LDSNASVKAEGKSVPKGRESGMPEMEYWESFFQPECMLRQLGLSESTRSLVEFGCGYGTFTIPAGKIISGTVHALDIDPELTDLTIARARAAGLFNVEQQVRDFVAHGSGLDDESVDFAILFNILHLEDPLGLLIESKRVVRPGGRVAIIHWRDDISTPRGPSLAIRPSLNQCRQWAESVNLRYDRTEQFTGCDYHWGLLMSKQ